MPKIKLDRWDYEAVEKLIDQYLSDICIEDEKIQLPYASDILDDVLTELGIEKE